MNVKDVYSKLERADDYCIEAMIGIVYSLNKDGGTLGCKDLVFYLLIAPPYQAYAMVFKSLL